MPSNRVRPPNNGATRNEDKPDPCEVKQQQGHKRKRNMKKKDLIEKLGITIQEMVGGVIGFILSAVLGFELSGWNRFRDYLDREPVQFFVFIIVGTIVGGAIAHIYGVMNAMYKREKQRDGEPNKDKGCEA